MLDINNTHHKIDFIGDIHGHADALRKLLSGLNYNNENGVYKHAERKAFLWVISLIVGLKLGKP